MYCNDEMHCNVLAGASIDDNDPEILLQSLSRYYSLLPATQQGNFLLEISGRAS